MSSQHIIRFDDTPLVETVGTITLDIYSGGEESGLRGKPRPLEQKKVLEGKITLNLTRCMIFSLPPPVGEPFAQSFRPDPARWDLYLICIPFTLHRAPEHTFYHEMTFFVEMTHPDVTAFDLFPKNIATPVEETQTFTLSPRLHVQAVGASLGQVSRELHFTALYPFITAAGEGESRFYWTYRGAGPQKEVVPGTKHALVVLQVPRGTLSVEGVVRYEVVIAKSIMPGWRYEDGGTDEHVFHWQLQTAPPFFTQDPSTILPTSSAGPVVETRSAGPLYAPRSLCDVCIVCALPEEAQAFMDMARFLYNIEFTLAYSGHDQRPYYAAQLPDRTGRPITMHLSWLPGYGPEETALHLRPVLEEFHPRLAAMTGICAGDKKKVCLGDIIVAERAFLADSGKFIIDGQSQQKHLLDTNTWHTDMRTLHFARLFRRWEEAVARLARPSSRRQQRDWLLQRLLSAPGYCVDMIPQAELEGHAPAWRMLVSALQQPPHPYLTTQRALLKPGEILEMRYGPQPFPYTDPPQSTCHIAPIASSYAVRSDNPFSAVQVPVRGTLAIDMEGATFYRTMAEFSGIRSLLVKGVSDYADNDKDDTYHQYAAKASAAYLLSLLREYMPVLTQS